MIEEKIILQVLAEQKEYLENYRPEKRVDRNEEQFFELDSALAQVASGGFHPSCCCILAC